MKASYLIYLLKQFSAEAHTIEQKDCDKRDFLSQRLSNARRDLKNNSFDAIEYRDIFELKDENKYSSFKEYREKNGSGIDTIETFRKLSAFVCNKGNDWKGEYILINN